MYYFLFKHRPYDYDKKLNIKYINTITPLAKVYDHGVSEECRIQAYFKLTDPDSYFSAIEVESTEDADKLLLFPEKLTEHNRWYKGRLIYVFKDIDFSKVDEEAVMLKLTGNEKYQEEPEISENARKLNYLNKKFTKFMSDVAYASSAFDKSILDKINEAKALFEAELDTIRDERKKAKAEANKKKNSLRRKLIKYAIYKNAR